MASNQQWGLFKAKMEEQQLCTNYAARALLVQEFVKQERTREEDAARRKPAKGCSGPSFEQETKRFVEKLQRSISVAGNLDQEVLLCEKSMSLLSVFDDQHETRNNNSKNIISSLKDQCSSPAQPQWDVHPKGANPPTHLGRSTNPPLISGAAASTQERVAKQESKARRQRFDKLVNGVIGKEQHPKRRCQTERRRSFAGTIDPSSRQANSYFGDSRRASFGLQDTKALSVHLLTFVDDLGDEVGHNREEPYVKNEDITPTRPTRQKLKRGGSNASIKQFFKKTSSPSTLETQLSSTTFSEVEMPSTEIRPEGESLKVFALEDEEEILVDFPSVPRHCLPYSKHQSCPLISYDVNQCITEHDSDISDGEHESRTKITVTKKNKARRRSSTGITAPQRRDCHLDRRRGGPGFVPNQEKRGNNIFNYLERCIKCC
mmetsp:Transcript_7031/g.11676  ORF Transcript_7031/g.11676 Transcript_7031/m.11676 type:complete len:433 (-) Transcript_7031:260-1558(-)|eukprot:CAMPEP_0119031384 /NCGR_PEP_ID=MMETSP1176-20130426/41513_1 /TAXON_ID=265551 /ORGANISM="Synedropsis recta cf, Strain CCMP1620" /LENGTH=432 /DNA_ID=CAMNT_0006987777 /DNA_START=248 /DNA_END=1546 /DNA_ORIENTATION=+